MRACVRCLITAAFEAEAVFEAEAETCWRCAAFHVVVPFLSGWGETNTDMLVAWS